MTEVSTQPATETPEHGDFEQEPFRRLRYFHGQMLTARDFQREQEYFREKLKLRMRCLLGYGVVCGLFVEPVENGHDDKNGDDKAGDDKAGDDKAGDDKAKDADKDTDEGGKGGPDDRHGRAKVRLTSGLGVDCDGNEVPVNGSCVVDLREAVQADERTGGSRTVWIGIEYTERAVEPTRTVFNSSCADTSDCEYGYTEECHVVRVTTHEPPRDERCETCCSRCEHKVLWLARIDDVDWDRAVRADQIHMNVRRPFGKRVPTVITGVNWIHGHTYTVDEAKQLLGTQKDSGGLVVWFSDDVRTDALRPGVVDIQVIEGGAGRNADTWYMGGKFEEPDDGEFTRRFRYRQTTRETLQDGDRVLITVRAAFILDKCCRPVDGTNVGGKVPFVRRGREVGADDPAGWPDPYATADASTATHPDHPGHPSPDPEPSTGCAVPPSGVDPWTSGTGAGGDVFESWFFVTEERR
jgi:hypothetical protein